MVHRSAVTEHSGAPLWFTTVPCMGTLVFLYGSLQCRKWALQEKVMKKSGEILVHHKKSYYICARLLRTESETLNCKREAHEQ